MPNAKTNTLNPVLLAGLQCFQVAAHHLSFTRAATELHLTQSAVSHRIKSLEQQLGFPLFLRFNRRLQLTPEGEQLQQVTGESLYLLDSCVRDLRNRELGGHLVLSIPPSLALSWLAPRLAQLRALHPRLQLHVETRSRVVDFSRESVDVAIYYGVGPYPGLYQQPLLQETLQPVCSPAYARQQQLSGDPKALPGCTLLHDSAAWPEAGAQAEWQHWCEASGIELPDMAQSYYFDLMELAVAAACSGLGLAMGRQTLVAERLANGELLTPFNRPVVSAQHYVAVCHPARHRQPAIQALLNWLGSETTVQA